MKVLKSLLSDFESALHSFTSSSSKFCIVRTVNPTSTLPKTLYILDSSFNPPSIGHLALATSALIRPSPADDAPYRVLLLFSTANADKTPDPSKFAHRIALMTLFAEDLRKSLTDASAMNSVDTRGNTGITIDIGLTKEPYYSDKSDAIAHTIPRPYPKDVTHVHLIGYDTLIRFCNPKYYPKYDPPLSALAPFFKNGHKLRVTQRPYDTNDNSSKEFGTIEEQRDYLKRLRDGEREHEGFRKEWADNIDMVEGGNGVGVSSTRLRNAARDGDWDTVGDFSTEGVAAWVKETGLYSEEASGKD
jgi:nicotinamide-nucleotide adenylyltransferase